VTAPPALAGKTAEQVLNNVSWSTPWWALLFNFSYRTIWS